MSETYTQLVIQSNGARENADTLTQYSLNLLRDQCQKYEISYDESEPLTVPQSFEKVWKLFEL